MLGTNKKWSKRSSDAWLLGTLSTLRLRGSALIRKTGTLYVSYRDVAVWGILVPPYLRSSTCSGARSNEGSCKRFFGQFSFNAGARLRPNSDLVVGFTYELLFCVDTNSYLQTGE